MIVRLLLLIVFIFIAVTLVQIVRNTPRDQLKKVYWKFALSAAAIVLVLLAVTGRIHWLGALLGAMLPFLRSALPMLIKLFPLWHHYQRSKPQPPPSSGNRSQVNTSVLQMTLDHDSQHLNGTVISGPFQGKQLDALELSELQTLLDYCQQQDKEAAKLLISYLNHRFGNRWQQSPPPHQSSVTGIDAAYAILGLARGASKTEIIQAHRRMMQKVHPDRGGSDYLAAQINEAKDILLKQLDER